MKSTFGWQTTLTRALSVGAVLGLASTAVWAQAVNPIKPTPEPSPAGSASQASDSAPRSAPTTAPARSSSQPAAAAHGSDMQPAEASGTQPVFGAHFDHSTGSTGHMLKITKVDPNGPASHAGLMANDRLVTVDGRTFANPRQLIAYLSVAAGRPVPIVLDRNGQQMTVQLFPGQFQGDRAWLGVLLEENNKNDNEQSVTPKIPTVPGQPDATAEPNRAVPNPNVKGAEISRVYPNGPAARAGLRSGDVIVQVNGQRVDDAAELVAAVHEMKPQTQADLQVLRDNKEIKIPITLGSRNQELAQFGGQGQFGPGQFGPGQGGPGQFGPNQFGPGQPWQGPGQFPGPRTWQGQEGAAAYGPNDFQRIIQQNQQIQDELKQLREEIKQLREQNQKK